MEIVLTQHLWQILVATAVSLQVAASVWYLSGVVRHRTVLNASSWGLWSILTFLNAASYASIAPSASLAVIPILTALSTFCTFIAAIALSSYAKLDRVDVAAAAAGIVAASVWLASGNPNLGSLVLQAAFVIGFIPTIRAILHRTIDEPVFPWALWTLSYAANLTSLAISEVEKTAAAFAYPLTSIALHTLVFSCALVAHLYQPRVQPHLKKRRARSVGW